MGRVLETFPGTDGLVRVVSVKPLLALLGKTLERCGTFPSMQLSFVPGGMEIETADRSLAALYVGIEFADDPQGVSGTIN